MSTGPIVQLVAKADEDKYLTETPEISFFKSVWHRHTNHAFESIAQTFNGAVSPNAKVSALIGRHGDLAYRTWLEVELPAVEARTFAPGAAGAALRPAGDIYSLIQHVTVEIGGTRIDRHHGEWMRLWDELTVPHEHRATLHHLTHWDEEDGWLYGQPRPAPPKIVRVPLSFWFCKDAGNALPLVALRTHETRVTVRLTDKIPAGAKLRLWVDYVFLDTEERKVMARDAHEFLIEQVQASVDERVPNRANRVKKVRLDFNHPVKELFWVLRDAAGDIRPGAVQRARLLLNGEERFRERDGDYFSVVQRYAHHSCAGDIFPGDTTDVLAPFVAMTTQLADGTASATYDANAQTLTSLGTAHADPPLPTGQQVGGRILSPDHFNSTDPDFGRHSALSSDGTLLVVGSLGAYKTATDRTGSVRTYQQTAAGAWALISEIYGGADGQGFGRPALSDDGLTLVVGSSAGSHAVRAYRRKPAPALAPALCTIQTEAPAAAGGLPYQSYLTTAVAVSDAAGEEEAHVAIPGADSLSYYSPGAAAPTDVVLTLAPDAGAGPWAFGTQPAYAENRGISVRFETGNDIRYMVSGSSTVVSIGNTAGHAGFLGLRAVRKGAPPLTVFEISVGGEVVEEVGAPHLATTDGLHAGVWFGNRDSAAAPVLRGLRVNEWVPVGAPILAENTYSYVTGAVARAIPGSLLYPYEGANGVDTTGRYQFASAADAEAAARLDGDALGYRLDTSARVRVERNASIPFNPHSSGTPTLNDDYWNGPTFGNPAIGVVTMDASGAFTKQPTPSSGDGWVISGVTAVAPSAPFDEGATLYGATYDPSAVHGSQAAAEAAALGAAGAIGYWKQAGAEQYYVLTGGGTDTYSGAFGLPSAAVEQTWARSSHAIDWSTGLGLDWVTMAGGSFTYTSSRVDVVSFVCEEEGFVDMSTAVSTEAGYDFMSVLVWRNYGTVTDISQRNGHQRLLASMSIATQLLGRSNLSHFDESTGQMLQAKKEYALQEFRSANAAIYDAYTEPNAITGADVDNIEYVGAYTSTGAQVPTSVATPNLMLRRGEVMYVMFYSDYSTPSTQAQVNFSASTATTVSGRYTLLYPPALRPSATPRAFADDSNTVLKVAAQPSQLHGVVAIDEDGDTVAIGAPQHTPDAGDPASTEAGQVRVFQYAGEAWTQLGPDIDGASYSEHAGFNTVCLSASGRTVAFGARNYDVGAGAALETVPVTVATDGDGDSVFVLSGPSVAGTAPDEISLQVGNTYVFDQSDASNDGHLPIRFENDPDENGGWVPVTSGVSTDATARTVTWVVPDTLGGAFRYACGVHGAGMGGPLTLRANPHAVVTQEKGVTVADGAFVVSGGAADVVAPATLPLVEGYTYAFHWTDATNASGGHLTFESQAGDGSWVVAAGVTLQAGGVTQFTVPVGLSGPVRYAATPASGGAPAGGPVHVVSASSRQNEGCVRVYDYEAGLWTQRGADIVDAPPVTAAQFGCRVGMSRDGQVVAGGDSNGRIRVLSWGAGGAWVGRGPPVTDFGGLSAGLTLSGDGGILSYATDDNDAAVRYWDGEEYKSLVRDLLVAGAATATPAAQVADGAASGHVDGVGLEEAAYQAATYGAKALLQATGHDDGRYYFVYDAPGAPGLQAGSAVGSGDTVQAVYTVASTVGDANFVEQSRDGRRVVLGAVGQGVRVFSLPAPSSRTGFNGFGYVNGQGTYGLSTTLPTLLAGTQGLSFQVHLLLSPVPADPVASSFDTAAYDAQRRAGVRLVLDDAGAALADAFSTAEQDSLAHVATLDTGSNDFDARAGVRFNRALGTFEAFVSNPSGESVASFPAPAGTTPGNLNASVWLFSVNSADRVVANSLQWQQVRESQPVDRQGFVYMYSFALAPEQLQPSGTCNFSKITNANLELTTGANDLQDMRVYAVNYNVLRVKDGMGSIAYST